MVNGLYPFTGNFAEIQGHRLHYLDEGAGHPVLMVHGNPTWSAYYRGLIGALHGSFRCIAPDHIGCGLSDKPNDDGYDYTLRRRVDDLAELIEGLNLSEALTLVVHDWGGMIGMAWAVEHPDQVRRIVVLNTSAFHLPPEKTMPATLRLARDSALGAFLVRGCNAFTHGANRFCCTRNRMSRDVRRLYAAPYDSWANRIAVLRFVQDIPLRPADPSYDLVSKVEMGVRNLRDRPMLICWGMRDFVFDEHFLQRWCDEFPDAEVHRFDDCGHYILEDAGRSTSLRI